MSGLGGKGVTGRRRKAAEGSRPLPTMQKAKGWHSKAAGRACPAPTELPFTPAGFGGTPDSKVEEGAGALRTKSNTAFV